MMKRRTKDKSDEHLQSHSLAQLSKKKYRSFSIFGNFVLFLGSNLYPIFYPLKDKISTPNLSTQTQERSTRKQMTQATLRLTMILLI